MSDRGAWPSMGASFSLQVSLNVVFYGAGLMDRAYRIMES